MAPLVAVGVQSQSRSGWCSERWASHGSRNVGGALHRSHSFLYLPIILIKFTLISPIYNSFFYAYLHLHLSIYCIYLYIYIQIHDVSMIINPSKLSTPSSPIWQVLPCRGQLRRHVDGIFLQGLGFFVARHGKLPSPRKWQPVFSGTNMEQLHTSLNR